MNLIVAVDKIWGIGKDNSLLVSVPEDMKFFREMTTGKIIIMGRKTLESFPKQKPLPNRINIVISRDINLKIDGAIVCNSLEAAFKYVKETYGEERLKETFVIGGESIYKQALEYCDIAYVTHIKEEFEADRYFPNLHELDNWEMARYEMKVSENGMKFAFSIYENLETKSF